MAIKLRLLILVLCFPFLTLAMPKQRALTVEQKASVLVSLLQNPKVIAQLKEFGTFDSVMLHEDSSASFTYKTCSIVILFHLEANSQTNDLIVIIDNVTQPVCAASGMSVGSH